MDIELNSMVRLGSKNDDSLSVSEHPSDYDRDRQTLARLGKKQVLKVCIRFPLTTKKQF